MDMESSRERRAVFVAGASVVAAGICFGISEIVDPEVCPERRPDRPPAASSPVVSPGVTPPETPSAATAASQPGGPSAIPHIPTEQMCNDEEFYADRRHAAFWRGIGTALGAFSIVALTLGAVPESLLREFRRGGQSGPDG